MNSIKANIHNINILINLPSNKTLFKHEHK